MIRPRDRHCSPIWQRAFGVRGPAKFGQNNWSGRNISSWPIAASPKAWKTIQFASGWREWAICYTIQERYSEAWVKAKRARELNAEPFSPEFLKKLSAKMPEPK